MATRPRLCAEVVTHGCLLATMPASGRTARFAVTPAGDLLPLSAAGSTVRLALLGEAARVLEVQSMPGDVADEVVEQDEKT